MIGLRGLRFGGKGKLLEACGFQRCEAIKGLLHRGMESDAWKAGRRREGLTKQRASMGWRNDHQSTARTIGESLRWDHCPNPDRAKRYVPYWLPPLEVRNLGCSSNDETAKHMSRCR